MPLIVFEKLKLIKKGKSNSANKALSFAIKTDNKSNVTAKTPLM